jgi:hypothetical protein
VRIAAAEALRWCATSSENNRKFVSWATGNVTRAPPQFIISVGPDFHSPPNSYTLGTNRSHFCHDQIQVTWGGRPFGNSLGP